MFKKFMSLILAISMVLPSFTSLSFAETNANMMSAKMISFLQSNNSIEDVKQVSRDEVQVYGVFLSNFYKPGITTLEDLSKGKDSDLVKKVDSLFFGSGDTKNLETLAGIHKILYDASLGNVSGDISSESNGTLYATSKGTKPLTGVELLKKMSGEDKDRIIYWGRDKNVFLDLSKPQNQGAFKMLAGYSIDFMLGKDGLSAMTELHVDGFGNIWGAYSETIPNMKETRPTEKAKLKLVLPACLNPASFTSNTKATVTQDSLKLPLANSFSMGSFIDVKSLSANGLVNKNIPQYNILSYMSAKDITNAVNIYGIASPSSAISNTDKAVTTDIGLSKGLDSFYGSELGKLKKDKSTIKIVTNLKPIKDSIKGHVGSLQGKLDVNKLTASLLTTINVPTTKVADKLYYFGTGSNQSFKSFTTDLGLLEAGLFTGDGSSYYLDNSVSNGLTTKLATVYAKNEKISEKSFTGSNVSSLRESATDLKNAYALTDTKVQVNIVDGYSKLVYAVGNLKEDGSNIKEVMVDGEKHSNKSSLDVPQSVAAILYLNGAIKGEALNNVPSAFGGSVVSTLPDASKTSIANWVLNVPLLKWDIALSSNDWVYGLDPIKDSKLINKLLSNTYTTGNSPATSKYVDANMLTTSTFNADSGAVALADNQMYLTNMVYTLFGAYSVSDGTGVNTSLTTKVDGKDVTFKTSNKLADTGNYWPGIFFGYLVDILSVKEATKYAADGSIEKFDMYSFTTTCLPTSNIDVMGSRLDLSSLNTESGVSNSDEKTLEETQKDLIKKLYGITSDTPNSYRDRWLKATIDGFLLSIHRSITGSWLANMSTVSAGSGSTYQGIVGYIHTPALTDVPFTAWMITNYMNIYALLMLLIIMLLIIMVLLRLKTLSQGVFTLLVMCFALLIPQLLLGNTINITNQFTDNIYSNRFDFWAMTQHQQSLKSLEGLSRNSKEYVIASTMEKAKDTYSGDAGVRVKWMSPKKNVAFASLTTDSKLSESLATNLTIFKWLFSSFIYESEFANSDPFAIYVYRPYNSITLAGSEYFKLGRTSLFKVEDGGGPSASGIGQKMALSIDIKKDKKTASKTIDTTKELAEIYKDAKKSERNPSYDKYFYAALLKDRSYFTSDNILDIYYSQSKVENINKVGPLLLDDSKKGDIGLWGIGNKSINEVIFSSAKLVNQSSVGPGVESNITSNIPSTMDIESAHLTSFLLNTESPYYYFYNTLLYKYGNATGDRFKDALLNKDIYKVRGYNLKDSNTVVNGNLRDFLDLEGLFTYEIPYLMVANDYVSDWTSLNGTDVQSFDFSKVTEESESTEDATEIDVNSISYQKNLKDEMGKVWNLYSPWVAQLNELDVHNAKIKIGHKTRRVENSLNPSFYLLQGRPMVFSEADMLAKGYRVTDLSDIEIRMQRVTEATYHDMQYLVNYYDLKDEVLIGAAAMYATFNFNREFSNTELIGSDVRQYPQSFEMKNFNYDAFMRLALLNATGEPLFAESDLYERIASKTSIVTGFFLICADILAVILIPGLKLVILLMLLYLGLLLCLTSVVSPPEKLLQAIGKSIFYPTLLFMVLNICFAGLMSVIIGDGLTAYVGSKSVSIATNDPTLTILAIIFLDSVYSLLLYKLIKMMSTAYKEFGLATLFATSGILKDGLFSGVKAIGNMVNRGVTGNNYGYGNYNGYSNSKDLSSMVGAGVQALGGTLAKGSNAVLQKSKGYYNDADKRKKSNPRDLEFANKVNEKIKAGAESQSAELKGNKLGKALAIGGASVDKIVGIPEAMGVGLEKTAHTFQNGWHGLKVAGTHTKAAIDYVGSGDAGYAISKNGKKIATNTVNATKKAASTVATSITDYTSEAIDYKNIKRDERAETRQNKEEFRDERRKAIVSQQKEDLSNLKTKISNNQRARVVERADATKQKELAGILSSKNK